MSEETSSGPRIRLVWRKADMTVPVWPGVITARCSRCTEQVCMDSRQQLPPAFQGREFTLVCVPCGLDDPELRPGVLACYARIRRQALTRQRQAAAGDAARTRRMLT
jgi:hypothetical protein